MPTRGTHFENKLKYPGSSIRRTLLHNWFNNFGKRFDIIYWNKHAYPSSDSLILSKQRCRHLFTRRQTQAHSRQSWIKSKLGLVAAQHSVILRMSQKYLDLNSALLLSATWPYSLIQIFLLFVSVIYKSETVPRISCKN